jgi:hypothetical protein
VTLHYKRYADDTYKKEIDTNPKTKDRKTWTPTTKEEEDIQEAAADEDEASAEDEADMAEEQEVFPRAKKEN